MDISEIERRLAEVLNKATGWLPESQLTDMRSLNAAGEPGVALENFSTQLYEYDVPIPAETWEELRRLGRAMGLQEKYWERLSRK